MKPFNLLNFETFSNRKEKSPKLVQYTKYQNNQREMNKYSQKNIDNKFWKENPSNLDKKFWGPIVKSDKFSVNPSNSNIPYWKVNNNQKLNLVYNTRTNPHGEIKSTNKAEYDYVMRKEGYANQLRKNVRIFKNNERIPTPQNKFPTGPNTYGESLSAGMNSYIFQKL